MAGLVAGCVGATTPTVAPTKAGAPTQASAATPTIAAVQPAATAVAPVAEATAVSTQVDATKDDAYAEVLTFNNSAWNYDATNDVYWQIGVQYAATPETLDYETLGIYVPGAYMSATTNGDGTYTAEINEAGTLNGFTAKTALLVFPVNTPGYSAQKAPTAYSYNNSSYLKAGFIYVQAGIRGKANGFMLTNS